MSKFEQYNIPLKGLKTESQVFEFDLDDNYFKKIDSPEVQHGKIKATVTVRAKQGLFDLNFVLNGVIQIPCDRCLDEMNQPIQKEHHVS